MPVMPGITRSVRTTCGPNAVDRLERILGIGGGQDVDAIRAQRARDELETPGVVVDDQDGDFGRAHDCSWI